jgi:hypothetical protein
VVTTSAEHSERIFEAVVHTYEGDDHLVPEDLREASFVKRARRYRESLASNDSRIALRKLMKESAAVLALAEPQLRDEIGHTNVAVFKQRIEEAGALLEVPEGEIDVERLWAQSLQISQMMADAGVPAMTLTEGVRYLIERASVSPKDEEKKPYIPWRGVVSLEPIENGETILRLECGHADVWGSQTDIPVATKCPVCDPPTFHGQPFSHPLIDARDAKIKAANLRKAASVSPKDEACPICKIENHEIVDLLRAFEPPHSSRIPRATEVLDKIRALQAASGSPQPEEQIKELKAEIAEAREACPIVRRQDYFDAPLLTLINAEISQLFQWQSRAEKAEAALASQPEGWQPTPQNDLMFRLALQAGADACFEMGNRCESTAHNTSDEVMMKCAEGWRSNGRILQKAALPPPPAGEPGGQT